MAKQTRPSLRATPSTRWSFAGLMETGECLTVSATRSRALLPRKRQKKQKKTKKQNPQKPFFCPFQQRGICKKLHIRPSKKLKAASRQT
jgi:hypothetical protein